MKKKLPTFLRPSKLINYIENYISIKILKSGISIRDKIKSEKHLKKAVRFNKTNEVSFVAKKNGFVELQPLSIEISKSLSNKFDKLIDMGIDTSMDKSNSQLAIPYAEKKFDIKSLIDDQTLETVKAYFGSEVEIKFVNAIRNFGKKTQQHNNKNKKISETFSDKWHFDGSDKYILKLFILIKETTINHGPFHILDLKNTRLAIDKGYLSRRNYGLDENEFNRLSYKFIGGAGKRILAATNKCLHRASMPDYGLYRDMLVICFSPSDKKFDFNEIGNRISRMNFELL